MNTNSGPTSSGVRLDNADLPRSYLRLILSAVNQKGSCHVPCELLEDGQFRADATDLLVEKGVTSFYLLKSTGTSKGFVSEKFAYNPQERSFEMISEVPYDGYDPANRKMTLNRFPTLSFCDPVTDDIRLTPDSVVATQDDERFTKPDLDPGSATRDSIVAMFAHVTPAGATSTSSASTTPRKDLN